MISVNDPDARHTRKSPEARRDGYRAHVAADPDTGVITGEKLTKAAGTENSDAAVAAEFVAAETAADTGTSTPAAVTVTPAASSPGTAIRPTAPGTCGRPSPRPGTRR